MKKEQLRESFARIQPREELIQSTLDKIREQRERGASAASERKRTLGFATRLATAACALLLVIGVGVMFARNDMVPTDPVVPADDGRTAPMTADCQGPSNDVVISDGDGVLSGCEQMMETARGYGSDWAVLAATIDAVYFPNTDEGRVTLRPTAVAGKLLSGDGAAWTSSEQDALAVCFDASDDGLRALLTTMGDVLVGIHTEEREGDTVWVIHEAYAEDVPVE